MDFLGTFAVLDPKGVIALAERSLIINVLLLMLIVVVPVFTLLFYFAWHYRASNKKAKYVPNWEHAHIDELIWWAIPFEIVLVLAAFTWTSSHELDPYKPLESDVPPVTIEVVSLNWKWLFIYPELHIATVNYLQIPVDTPIALRLTADSPMNAFWVPQLGGQVYAMTGMTTQLHLMADTPGSYNGVSSSYSGVGFAGMRFTVRASSQEEFDTWVEGVRRSPNVLTSTTFQTLAEPSENDPPSYYGWAADDLFASIVGMFMPPMTDEHMHMH